MSKSKNILVFDLGGTHIRLGVVHENSKIILKEKLVVGRNREPKDVAKIISSWIQCHGLDLSAIVAGVPGIVDTHKGIIYSSPHFPSWKKVPFARLLNKLTQLPVFIDNDANQIARGELFKGAGTAFNSFIMLTLGTGIGGALVINKKVFTGDAGFTGEIGHLNVNPLGPKCNCGSRGCLETYVSHTALKRMIKKSRVYKKKLEYKNVSESEWGKVSLHLAQNGDILSKGFYKEMAHYLAIGIASIANVTGIFNFVIGGGLGNAFNLLKPYMLLELKNRIYSESYKRIKIVPAKLGDDAGLIGCCLFKSSQT